MTQSNQLFAWVPLFLLALVAAAARRHFGTWRRPAPFVAALWVASSVPAFVAAAAPILPLSVWVTSFLVSAFVLGSMFVSSIPRRARSEVPFARAVPSLPVLRTATGLCGCCGIVAVAMYVTAAEADASDLGTIEGWFAIAVRYSVARYEGADTETAFVRLLFGCNYAGAILAGVLTSLPGPRKRLVVAVPLLACGLVTLLTTAKAPLLLGVLCVVSGRFACEMIWPRSVSGEQVGAGRLWIGLLMIAVAAISVTSLFFRYGGSAGADDEVLLQRISGYLYGQVYAFSAWISTGGLAVGEPGFGRYSFAGLAEILGIGTRASGFYEYIAINDAAADSNVFTAFRGLIQDFYLPGAAIVMILLGAIVEYLARCRSSKVFVALSASILVAIYLFLGFSPFISVFHFNEMIFAVALVFALLCTSLRSEVPSEG